MKKEVTEESALSQLAALCARGEHCRYEMTEKMRRWGLPPEAQQRVVERLVGERYVDDERYARALVADKIRYDHWGPRKVEQALWAKHIDEEVRRRVMDEVDQDDYLSSLRQLLKQKSRAVNAASDYELRGKLMKFALGRGFTFDQIKACISLDGYEEGDSF